MGTEVRFLDLSHGQYLDSRSELGSSFGISFQDGVRWWSGFRMGDGVGFHGRGRELDFRTGYGIEF
ncbi:hypothetical protein TIFTF001_018894 [Ficus carica]|uniref:Uncharacterized protein n=1 Tax=Ficus carica TaxID=3494 RepID=A0AA88ADB6_FICCA|nr:hypothetical protein TIFTF001_018894 [Ficus carica]